MPEPLMAPCAEIRRKRFEMWAQYIFLAVNYNLLELHKKVLENFESGSMWLISVLFLKQSTGVGAEEYVFIIMCGSAFSNSETNAIYHLQHLQFTFLHNLIGCMKAEKDQPIW